MRYAGYVTIAALVLLLSACSAQSWHEGLKYRQQEECYKLPDSSREECLRSLDYSFDEYRSESRQVDPLLPAIENPEQRILP